MPDLRYLTSDYWKNFKKRAGINNKKWLGSDAKVGSAITRVNTARAKWKQAKTDKNLMSYFRALGNLKNQFDKFLHAKDFKTDIAMQLGNEIRRWKTQIDLKTADLAQKYNNEKPKLAKANADQLGEAFDQFIL